MIEDHDNDILHRNRLGMSTMCKNCGKIQLTFRNHLYIFESEEFKNYCDYVNDIYQSILGENEEPSFDLNNYFIDEQGIGFSSPNYNCLIKFKPDDFDSFAELMIQSKLGCEIKQSLNNSLFN